MSALPDRAGEPVQVAAFYQFTALAALPLLQAQLQAFGQLHELRGTVLLAEEGINATISGGAAAIVALRELLHERGFAGLNWKQTEAEAMPFRRWKVRIKREIVSFGVDGLTPGEHTGVAVAPQQWDALIARDDVIVIDTRNDYEVAVGHFAGAIDPGTRAFSDFPRFVAEQLRGRERQPVAMYCTGGIRCEKASAYLLQQGFAEVYQLHGGILNYLATTPPPASRWQGECFVFDERVAVDQAQRGGRYVLCRGCGTPLPQRDGAFCDGCAGAATPRAVAADAVPTGAGDDHTC